MAEMPPTAAPSAPAPLPREGFGSLEWWRGQITAAEDKIDRYKGAWKKNISRQIGQPLEVMPQTDTVVVPIDHANIEQKKALLYFRNPDVQLVAAPGHEAEADVLQSFSAVVNEVLGADGVDSETMTDELLTDVLCPAGIGFSVIGLDVTTDGTEPMQIGTQETPAQGAVLNLQPVQTPIMEDVPKIVHQQYFWSRVSPLMGLLPARFHGLNFDRAPWLGYTAELDKAVAMRTLGLTEAEAAAATGDPDRLNEDEKPKTRDSDVVYVQILSYKGSLYNPAVKNPEEIWRLILVKGVNRVITHDRPYQQYAPNGALIGLRGHFIHVYTPRYVSDSAIPPSDVSMSRQQVGELQKGRSQMIQQRDRAKPMREVNISMLDPGQVEKMKRGEWQEILLKTTSEPIASETARATYPRENFQFNDIVTRDIDRAWGFGDSQRGIQQETKRTATELSLQASSSDTRMEKERTRFLHWYLRGAQKLAGLIQLFEDDRETVQIVGADNAAQIVAWKKEALPLRFSCTAELDTMIRTDTAREAKRHQDFYQMTVNDPRVDSLEPLTKWARALGYNVARLIKQPPPRAPEPPKYAVSLTGEDLNPAMPQFPNVQQILAAGGIQLDEGNVSLGLALAQKAMAGGGPVAHDGEGPTAGETPPETEHGGPAEQAEPLSKRSGDQTGKLSGMGMASQVQ